MFVITSCTSCPDAGVHDCIRGLYMLPRHPLAKTDIDDIASQREHV